MITDRMQIQFEKALSTALVLSEKCLVLPSGRKWSVAIKRQRIAYLNLRNAIEIADISIIDDERIERLVSLQKKIIERVGLELTNTAEELKKCTHSKKLVGAFKSNNDTHYSITIGV